MKHYLFSHRARRWAVIFMPGSFVATFLYCCFSVLVAAADRDTAYYAGLFGVAVAAFICLRVYGSHYSGADPFIARRMTYYLAGITLSFCGAFFLRWDFFWRYGMLAVLFISVIATLFYELAALVRWFHVHRLVTARKADRKYRRI